MEDLKILFKNIADIIRNKLGTTNLIKPNDFPNKIKSILESGGNDNTLYLDFRNVDEELLEILNVLAIFSHVTKFMYPGSQSYVVPSTMVLSSEGTPNDPDHIILGCAINLNQQIYYPSLTGEEGKYITSVIEYFAAFGMSEEVLKTLPSMTKEEFYSHNI